MAAARRTGGVDLKDAAPPLQLSRKTLVVTSTATAQKAATKIATNDVDVASNPSFQPTHFFMLLPLPWC